MKTKTIKAEDLKVGDQMQIQEYYCEIDQQWDQPCYFKIYKIKFVHNYWSDTFGRWIDDKIKFYYDDPNEKDVWTVHNTHDYVRILEND